MLEKKRFLLSFWSDDEEFNKNAKLIHKTLKLDLEGKKYTSYSISSIKRSIQKTSINLSKEGKRKVQTLLDTTKVKGKIGKVGKPWIVAGQIAGFSEEEAQQIGERVWREIADKQNVFNLLCQTVYDKKAKQLVNDIDKYNICVWLFENLKDKVFSNEFRFSNSPRHETNRNLLKKLSQYLEQQGDIAVLSWEDVNELVR